MKLQLLFIGLLCCQVLLGQENITGIGLVSPEILGFEIDSNNPEELDSVIGFELYDTPDISSGDCLIITETDRLLRKAYVIDGIKKTRVDFYSSGMVWTSYKSFCLQYYEEKNGFLKVKINDANYWIKQENLANYGYSFTSWESYFKNTTSKSIAVIYNLNLRAAADVNADKIVLLKTNPYNNNDFYHLMQMTGKFEGNWAEVEVSVSKNETEACSRKNEPKKVVGWVKYLDDKGFPNLFDIPTPCGC